MCAARNEDMSEILACRSQLTKDFFVCSINYCTDGSLVWLSKPLRREREKDERNARTQNIFVDGNRKRVSVDSGHVVVVLIVI